MLFSFEGLLSFFNKRNEQTALSKEVTIAALTIYGDKWNLVEE